MQLFKMFGEVAIKGGKAVTKQLKVIDLAAERTKRGLDAIPNEVDVEVDVDTDKSESKLSNFLKSIGLMRASMMALGPSIAPVMASLTAGIGGLATSFAVAGAGVATFASIAIPALSGIFEASKEVEKINEKIANADTVKERKKAMQELQQVYSSMTKKERQALNALQDFKSFWSGFVKSLENPVLDIFIQSLGTLKSTLSGLKPFFESSIKAIGDLFKGMDKSAKSPKMKEFFQWLAVNMPPAIKSFGTAFGNVMKGIANLLMAFTPISGDMQDGLVGLTKKFADWTAGLKDSQGFKDFIEYAKTNGPKLIDTLGQIASIMLELIKAMAPFGPIVLDILQALLQLINHLLQFHPAVGIVLVGMLQLIGIFKLVSGPVTGVISGFKKMKDAFGTTGTPLNRLRTLIKTFGTNLSSIFKTGLLNARIAIQMFGQAFMRIGPAILQFVTGLIPKLISGFMSFLRVLNIVRLFLFTNPLGLIILAVVAVVAAAIMLYKNWDSVKKWLLSIWKSITDACSNAFKWAVKVISDSLISAKNWVTKKLAEISNGFSQSWSSIKNALSNNSIAKAISDGLNKAWSAIKGFFSTFNDAGIGLLTSFKDGIVSGFKNALSAVKSGLNTIRQYLPFSPAKEGPLSDLDTSGESFFPTWASRIDKGLNPALSKITSGMTKARGAVASDGLSQGMGLSVNKMGLTSPAVGAFGGIMITGNTFVIREEADIQRVAVELFKLQQRESRGLRGGVR